MKKKYKLFIGLIVVFGIVALAVIGGNIFIENKLKTVINENLSTTEFKYQSLNVSILSNSAAINRLIYSGNSMQISAEKLKINGLDIWQYLNKNKLRISNIKLTNPEVVIYTGNKTKKDTSGKMTPEKMDLLIHSVEITNGSFKMAKNDSVKSQLFVRIPLVNLKELSLDQKSLKKGLPFDYENLQMTSDSLFFSLNKQHDLFVDKIKMNGDSLKFSKIKLSPLYDKQEFQQHIPYEKDRFDLSLDELVFKSFNWSLIDSLKIESENTSFRKGDISIYRDKRVENDTRRKPMYSEMIRELPFKLKLDTVKVKDFAIQYQELVNVKRGAGKVTFKNLDASIYNLTNVGMNSEDFRQTNIEVQTQFQGEAKLNVDWSFDISNKAEAFTISGQMDRISSEGINQFLTPALNVKAEGGIRNMRFDFSGNEESAMGDMKLVYHNFTVKVLKKNSEEKNEFLSALANLLINNDAASGEKVLENIKTQRNQKKSFWNYLWKNVRNGALKSFIKF